MVLAVRFNVADAPVPDGAGPLSRPFILAPLHGLAWALPAYLVTYLVWGIVGAVLPAWSPPHVRAGLGLSDEEVGGRVYFTLAALCAMAAACFLIANARRRVPVYGLTMGELNAALLRLRRRLQVGTPLGRLVAWFNLVAAVATWWIADQAGWWRIFREPSNIAPAGAALVLMALLAVNGIRLLSRGPSAVRLLGSIGLQLAGVLAALFAFLAAIVLTILVSQAALPPSDGVIGLSVVGAMGLGSFAAYHAANRVNALIAHRSAMLSAATAHDKLRQDQRKPVLFLRSFKDDNAAASTVLEPSKDERHFIRLEQAIAQAVHDYGSLIAIGQPGKIPKGGAARSFYQGDDWREAITAWMEQSLLIVMVAGYTKGVRWEYETAIANGHARKLILIFPPNDPNFEARWTWVRTLTGNRAFGAAMDQANREHAIIACTDSSGDLCVMSSRAATADDYRAALALAVYGKLVRTG